MMLNYIVTSYSVRYIGAPGSHYIAISDLRAQPTASGRGVIRSQEPRYQYPHSFKSEKNNFARIVMLCPSTLASPCYFSGLISSKADLPNLETNKTFGPKELSRMYNNCIYIMLH